jgi:uncharacterized protein (TIGR03437 family)
LPASSASRQQERDLAAAETFGKIPLSFEENRGQTDPRVAYLARGRDVALFLTASEAVLTSRKDTVRMRWPGANGNPEIHGIDKSEARSNYLIGSDPRKWVTGVPSFSGVRYGDVYPGVDLVFHGSSRRELEFDWVVKPGASPQSIRMAFDAARGLRLSPEGDLIVPTLHGELRQRKPYVYQEDGSKRQRIEAAYALAGKGEAGFQIGPYDRSRSLVIDPVLAYAVLLGGSAPPNGSTSFPMDFGQGIAVDAAGSAYVTGAAISADFPLAGPLQNEQNGLSAMVFKLNPAGTALVYSTFLGGASANSFSFGTSIAVDAAGNAYVTGSATGDFPLVNPQQSGFVGSDPNYASYYGDAFVAKLDASGSALVFSTYFGGSGGDVAWGIAVDGTGSSYVAGETSSVDFPTTQGAFQTTFHAGPAHANCPDGYAVCDDAFAAKFGPAGELVYSTLLGGAYSDQANGVAVDLSGNAYIVGTTYSPDFPVTAGAFQVALKGRACGGGQATLIACPGAFLTKLNASGSGLVFSTYLDSSGRDVGQAVAVDAAGSAYVTGQAGESDFPTTQGAFQPAAGWGAFVTKFSPDGSSLIYSTYLVGPQTLAGDMGNGIAVDPLGEATVVGYVDTLDFPVLNAIQSQNGGCADRYLPCPSYGGVGFTNVPEDAFITRLNPQGSALVYSTFFGGTGLDSALGVALDPAGNTYVTGRWGSAQSQFARAGLVQAQTGRGAFVLKIATSGTGPQFTSSSVVNGASFQGAPAMGGLATVFGTGLSKVSGIVQASGTPLPTQIAGTSVLYGGVLAPLLAVANVNGQEQINFQVPNFGVNATGNAGLVVIDNGTMNSAATLPIEVWGAGIFTTDGVHGAILHANYQPVTASNPAVGGEVLLLYATGLGPVSPDPGIGNPASASPLSYLTFTGLQVSLGGLAVVQFAGLAPGFVGLNQVNFVVPSGVPSGEQDLSLAIGSALSNTVKVWVK